MSNNQQWVAVCDVDEIDEEDVKGFEHAGKLYALYHLAGKQFYASDGICTHEQVRLADGFVFGICIECPRHNAKFDVRTGQAKSPPATIALKTYQTEVRGDKVYVLVG